MGAKSPKVKQPDDPDPTPTADPTPDDSLNAAREERKRTVKKNSRLKTILAGDPTAAADPAAKKNILG